MIYRINDTLCAAVISGIHRLSRLGMILVLLVSVGIINLHAANSAYSQNKKLNLNLTNTSLKDVFREIEANSEYIFFYSDDINASSHVTVRVNGETIDAIMQQVLKGTHYTYTVSDRQVFVKSAPKAEKTAGVPVAAQQRITASGKIVDQNGEGLIGANVLVKGTTNGVVTDLDGNFSIDVPANAVLVISYIGYATQEITVKDGTPVRIVLVEDSAMMDELVVVGYGVQKKANLTGSVSSMNAEALESRTVSSVSAALAGQMPGVTTIQSSGAPGAQTGSITIRGKNSINAASPLVVIDGVPSSLGAMNSLDPNDVESLSVLKDAASSAIYGVQAANGVILVTTKKGKKGSKSTVNYSGSVAWASPTALLDFLGAGDYAMLYNEAVHNDNPKADLPYSEADIEAYRNGTKPNTDWRKETFKSSSMETYHNVSISGGTEKTTYNGAIGYTFQDGLDKQTQYQRFNVRAGLDSQINNWFAAGLNVFGYRGTKEEGWDSYSSLLQYTNRLAPIYPVFNEDGSYFYPNQENPVAHNGRSGFRSDVVQEMNAIVYAKVNILPELSVKGLFSVRNNTQNKDGFKKQLQYGTYNSGLREGYEEYYTNNWYTTQLLANYNKTFGSHTIGAMAGFEQTEFIYKYTKATRKGGGDDNLTESLNTLDKSSQTNDDGGYETARRAYFGRLQYDFQNKYLFEANVRADASSRFPKDNRWGVFPAFSAGWRISEEEFMKEAGIDWLSNLKLRLGWGRTGNEELDGSTIYPSIATYGYGSYMFGDNLYSTAYETRYVNNQLQWASVTNYEAAVEAGFLDNRLGFELAVYKKKTNDMLLRLPVQGVLGMDAPYQNAGNMENTGFDLSLFHNNRINKDFSYAVNWNIAYVKNEITNMEGTEGVNPNNDHYWYLEGYPVGSFYGYECIGFFNTAEELVNEPKLTGKEQMGDLKFRDLNKDGKIDAANDRKVIGKDFPSWTSGLTLSLYYKNFDLMAFFQGAFDVDGYYENESAFAFFNNGKVLKRHLDRWTPDNHDATYPRITKDSQINFVKYNSFWLQDASYVRLKNLTFGYYLPGDLVRRAGIEKLRVYLSGENLFTFTGLDGIDPEAPSSTRGAFYSNVKKVSVGLKVTF